MNQVGGWIILAGLAATAYGAHLIGPGALWIFGGVLLVLIGAALSATQEKRKPPKSEPVRRDVH